MSFNQNNSYHDERHSRNHWQIDKRNTEDHFPKRLVYVVAANFDSIHFDFPFLLHELAIWNQKQTLTVLLLVALHFIEGVVRPPSELAITTGSPLSMIETQELVVPRSIPITLLTTCSPPFGSS
jgi:hypothetical protein